MANLSLDKIFNKFKIKDINTNLNLIVRENNGIIYRAVDSNMQRENVSKLFAKSLKEHKINVDTTDGYYGKQRTRRLETVWRDKKSRHRFITPDNYAKLQTLTNKQLTGMLGRTHSFIRMFKGLEGTMYNEYLLAGMTEAEALLEAKRQIAMRMLNTKMSYFVDTAGRHISPEAWFDRNNRYTAVKEHDDYIANEMSEFDWDLLRISSHADCSPLCLPYQDNIYSLSGKDKQYPPYDLILYSNGGGYRHPNCRHYHSPYFPEIAEQTVSKNREKIAAMSDEEINENYKRRQQGKYNNRKAKEMQEKYNFAKDNKYIDNKQVLQYRLKAKSYRAKAKSFGVNV